MIGRRHHLGNSDLADQLVRTLEASGGTAIAIAADVSEPDEVDAMFARTVDAFDAFDGRGARPRRISARPAVRA